jgi:hypothetical protein
MPSIVETRTIINYLHGININADLDWILLNNGENVYTIFLTSLNFYEQMYNEYSIIAQLNIFLKIYLILFILDHITENNNINGIELNMSLIDLIHTHSSLNSVHLLNLIYSDYGINMNEVTNNFLEPNFQTEEAPAQLDEQHQFQLPPNLIIDYIALYNDDGFDSGDESDDEEMEEGNDNDLELVNNLAINNPVDVSECPLCNEDVIYPQGDIQLPPGFCRVNCPRGHTFHCWCINRWVNQTNPTTQNFQNSCPICRNVITEMMNIQPPPQPPQPNGFGKVKFDLKKVNSDIKFLLKK